MPITNKVIIGRREFYSEDNIKSINNFQPSYQEVSVYYIYNGKDSNIYYSN